MNHPQAIPRNVATCPECGGTLFVTSHGNDDAGRPLSSCTSVDCERDDDRAERGEPGFHSYRQSDWMPVRDAVYEFCGVIED